MILIHVIHFTAGVSDNQSSDLTWLEASRQSCPSKEPIENSYYGIWWKNVSNWLMDPIKQLQCISEIHSVSDMALYFTNEKALDEMVLNFNNMNS